MIGNKLKALRMKKKATIVQLCEQLQMNPNTYAKYERNERDVSTETLCKFANFYGVTTDYLLNREDNDDELQTTIAQLSDIEMEQKFLRAYFELISPQLRAKVWEQLEKNLETQIAIEKDNEYIEAQKDSDKYITYTTTVGAEMDRLEAEQARRIADINAKKNAV
ncbi:MAG: helix-turn-helix domain-containing protein [Oscillospiraceae bacterium]|nr:helix-turn-helix domain-containing protein [Oscillospiraceae bacterium]